MYFTTTLGQGSDFQANKETVADNNLHFSHSPNLDILCPWVVKKKHMSSLNKSLSQLSKHSIGLIRSDSEVPTTSENDYVATLNRIVPLYEFQRQGC